MRERHCVDDGRRKTEFCNLMGDLHRKYDGANFEVSNVFCILCSWQCNYKFNFEKVIRNI